MPENVVRMTRDADKFPDSHNANVPADGVAEFEAAGWVVEGAAPRLGDMTVADLKALAAERGVDLCDATKKADIISALELAAEAETRA